VGINPVYNVSFLNSGQWFGGGGKVEEVCPPSGVQGQSPGRGLGAAPEAEKHAMNFALRIMLVE